MRWERRWLSSWSRVRGDGCGYRGLWVISKRFWTRCLTPSVTSDFYWSRNIWRRRHDSLDVFSLGQVKDYSALNCVSLSHFPFLIPTLILSVWSHIDVFVFLCVCLCVCHCALCLCVYVCVCVCVHKSVPSSPKTHSPDFKDIHPTPSLFTRQIFATSHPWSFDLRTLCLSISLGVNMSVNIKNHRIRHLNITGLQT